MLWCGWRHTAVLELWCGTEVVPVCINVPLVCLVGGQCEGSQQWMFLCTRLWALPSATLTSQQKTKTNTWMRQEIQFRTHTAHTLPTGKFGGHVCGVATVVQIVTGHKISQCVSERSGRRR